MSSAAPMQQATADGLATTAEHTGQLATQSQQISVGELADQRTQATTQRQLQSAANHSQQSRQFKASQQMAQHSALATQLKSMNAMMNAPALQRVDDDEALQAKAEDSAVQREAMEASIKAPKQNKTGLPDSLKSGIESLSGMSMDHVKVHYNSSQPAQLNAHAYAQGSEIHVAPRQEQHLPHEAWHVVQQAQGRVKPTMQMKEGVPVNDDQGLEHEADVMGAKAVQLTAGEYRSHSPQVDTVKSPQLDARNESAPLIMQRHTPTTTAGAHIAQAVRSAPTYQRVAVVQMVKGDDLLITATGIANNLNQQLLAKDYPKALVHYGELKQAAKDLNQRNMLSARVDQVFNRHLDGSKEAPGVNMLLKTAIAKFKEVIQLDYDTGLDELLVYVGQLEAKYTIAFEKMLTDIIAGNKGASQATLKKMAGMAKSFELAVKKKGTIMDAVSPYLEKVKTDTVVSYIMHKGKIEGSDTMSTLLGSQLVALDTTKFSELESKKRKIKLLIEGDVKKTAGLIVPEGEDEISTETKNGALAIFAGSEERRLEVARVLPDSVPNQMKVFAAIKPHHFAEDITLVSAYLTDVGIDHLDAAVSMIGLVGAKGTVAEINAFQKAAKVASGSPALSDIGIFLTGLTYSSLTELKDFVAVIGKVATLTKAREIWEPANSNKNVEACLALLGEGVIPDGHQASTLAIMKAFAAKTGKSTVPDWKVLLSVPTWSLEEVLGLAGGFDSNDGNAKAADWLACAKADGTLKGKPDEVRAQARLNLFANDEWYDSKDTGKLSSTEKAKKKYTQLLYAMLGKDKLTSLKDIDLNAMRGDFLSMLLFFHQHIAAFESGVGKGFDRGSEEAGTYSRSDKTHPLNKKYKKLAGQLGVDTSTLLQPLNSGLLALQDNGKIKNSTKKEVAYHTGSVGVASAGLPSHNLKNLDQQQLLTSKLMKDQPSKKGELLEDLFETGRLEKSTKVSRSIDGKAAVTDEVGKKLMASLAGSVGKTGGYNNFHDFLLEDRGKIVSQLSTVINSVTGGSEDVYAISTEGHPNLVLLCPPASSNQVKYGGSNYASTEKILPHVMNDFNGASGQEVKITQRGSFGFQRPTVTDTSESIRIWPGYAPVESLIPGLKAVIAKLRNKGGSETLGKLTDLDSIKTPDTGPVLHIEALKTAMRHTMIVLEKKVDEAASAEKKRVGEWIKTRLLIKLKQSGILLKKGAVIYGEGSAASASERNKHYLITADMTDKLQEYNMIYTAATLGDVANPNASHATPGKFKDSNDAYEKRIASKFGGLDYRVYYLDSGEQALITAGMLANRFEKGKDETDKVVAKSKYISHNPYFEIGVFGGDARSNLEKDGSGKIVHADLSPVITSGRTTPKPKAEINQEVRRTWQNTDIGKTVKHADMIPIIDITNSSLDAVTDLGKMPNNFIVVESLTKHAQLGADKFIMGRLIALSKTAGTTIGTVSKTNFLDLSQKIVGPVSNAAYNPLLAQVRANMDKALYTEETT